MSLWSRSALHSWRGSAVLSKLTRPLTYQAGDLAGHALLEGFKPQIERGRSTPFPIKTMPDAWVAKGW